MSARSNKESAMKLKQKCFVIPHKKDEQRTLKVKDIGNEVDVPIEELLVKIIERIHQEERR